MRKKRVGIAVLFLTILTIFLTLQFGAAHETRIYEIGDNTYQFVVGSLAEPVVLDEKTGVYLSVSALNAQRPGMEKSDMHEPNAHGHGMTEDKHAKSELLADLIVPEEILPGQQASFSFSIKNKDGKAPELMVHHARQVHVVIVSEDLSILGHIHPEDFGGITQEMKDTGKYPFHFAFPKAGKYLIAIDIMTKKGAFSKQFEIKVEGDKEEIKNLNPDFRTEKRFAGAPEEDADVYTKPVLMSEAEVEKGGYYVKFSAPETIRAGEEVTLKYHFEKDGNPVDDFETYLAAPMHAAIVRQGFNGFVHAHGGPPELHSQDEHSNGEHGNSYNIHHNGEHGTQAHGTGAAESFGPDMEVNAAFPKPGLYQVFGQVKHKGNIVVSAFMVQVEPKQEAHTDLNHANRNETVSHAHAVGNPVRGLEKTLKVEISAGNKKKIFDLVEIENTHGNYKADFIPTVATTLTYRFFGKINNVPVDLSFACKHSHSFGAEENTGETMVSKDVLRTYKTGAFSCPESGENIKFPEPTKSLHELGNEISSLNPATAEKTNKPAMLLFVLLLSVTAIIISLSKKACSCGKNNK